VDFKRSRLGRNPYRGFVGEVRGGARRIAGPKVVWLQTACDRACNHMVIIKVTFEKGPRERALTSTLIFSQSMKVKVAGVVELAPRVVRTCS
jgi:hypothetical protein